MFGKQIVLMLLVLLVATVPGRAESLKSRVQLNEIQKRIESAQVNLQEKKKSEIQFSRQLALLKTTLSRLDKRISALKKEQGLLHTQVSKQKQLISQSQQEIRRTGKRLEKRLVALYKEGEIGPLKVLFSANSPSELVQQYHYLTRIVEYDRQLLGEYRSVVEAHQQQLLALEQLKQQQARLLENEQLQREVATDGRRLQARLLTQVKSEKKLLSNELVQLKKKAQRLQQLLARLQSEASAVSSGAAVNLGAGKGKWLWPVRGEVLIGFGTKKDAALGTFYESNGIEIKIAPNTAIHAAAAGKVVFSDWFKGYGNLLILSHAGGFHTLYAQAATLAKSIGAEVQAGDVLATSGLGGRDSMYFEIRHNGAPVNPLNWLQRR